MCATRLVTVLLPFVPVTPMTGARTARANSSMSPITSIPRRRASAAIGSSSDTPGDINNCEAPSSSAQVEAADADVEPAGEIAEIAEARRRRACIGRAHRHAAPRKVAQTGCARLAEPYDDARHHRIFKVARPANTSTKLMIQKRTITFGSAHPFNSK